ncbi:unnamed protein product [Boreogadus saida]
MGAVAESHQGHPSGDVADEADLVYPKLLDSFIPQWLNHGMRSNDWRLEDPYYGLLGAGGPGRAGVSPGEPLACRQYTGGRRQGGHMTRQAL